MKETHYFDMSPSSDKFVCADIFEKSVDHFVHPDTVIYTKRGPKPIHAVTKTDFVTTAAGTYLPVAEVLKEKYNGKLYFVDGEGYHENHEILIVHGGMQHVHYLAAKHLTHEHQLVSVFPEQSIDIPELSVSDCMIYGILLSTASAIAGDRQNIRVGSSMIQSVVKDFADKNGTHYHVDVESGDVILKCPFRREMLFDSADAPRKIFYSPLALLPPDKLSAIKSGLCMSNSGGEQRDAIVLDSPDLARDLRLLFFRCRVAVKIDGAEIVKVGDDHGRWLDDRTYAQVIGEIDTALFSGSLFDIVVVAGNDQDSSYLSPAGIHHNGGGKRNGSFAIYLEPWHADIFDFIDLKKNNGEEERRARDMFYALWIPDLYMKRVEADETWSLMDPNVSRGLADVWGDDFDDLYQQYEAAGTFIRQIPARTLWNEILRAQIETGVPYMLYKDSVNRKTNQSNLGTIKSSNLCTEIVQFTSPDEVAVCLTGDTEIITSNGLKRIDQCNDQYLLSSFDDQNTETIRHEALHPASLIDNGERNVYQINIGGTRPIRATSNHKFLVQVDRNKDTKINQYQWKSTIELRANDKLVVPNIQALPSYSTVDIQDKVDPEYLTVGWLIGDGWQLPYEHHNTYGVCFGKTEIDAKDHVIPIIDRWHSLTEKAQNGGRASAVRLYTNKVGTMEWQSTKQGFVKYIQDRFGLMPHRGREKVMPDKLKYDIDADSQAAILSGYFSADGSVYGNHGKQYVQLTSASEQLLYDIQAMLRCFGIQSKVGFYRVRSRNTYQGRVVIHGRTNLLRFQRHINFMLCKDKRNSLECAIKTMTRTQVETQREWCPVKSCILIGKQKVFDLSMEKAHTFLAGGVVTHNCNLSSVSLPAFVNMEDVSYDLDKLHEIVKVVTRNLNKVIDVNYYPVPEAETSNMRHRPIGIGIQGLADVFCMLKYPFESQDARKLNRDIAETMYHAALEASCEIAAEREADILEYKQLARIEEKTKDIRKQMNSILKRTKFSQEELTRPFCAGAYDSYFWNGGCPVSKGILQYDMWGVTPSNRWDWDTLKQNIENHGIRNSLLMAPMPTASTSQIMSNMESFEPYTSNIYSRRTMAGEFVVVNKHLLKDLIEMGLWNDDMKQHILARKGSVQDIEVIPKQLREVYKTVWEIKQRSIIDMAADRGAFICQSQSMNIYIPVPTIKILTSMHMYAWKSKIKTGEYYLRCQTKAETQQFTVDPSVANSVTKLKQSNDPSSAEVILACSRDNPDCLACGA